MENGINGVCSRDAKELGKVTAKTCFRQADVNGDGKVSFREFEKVRGVKLKNGKRCSGVKGNRE